MYWLKRVPARGAECDFVLVRSDLGAECDFALVGSDLGAECDFALVGSDLGAECDFALVGSGFVAACVLVLAYELLLLTTAFSPLEFAGRGRKTAARSNAKTREWRYFMCTSIIKSTLKSLGRKKDLRFQGQAAKNHPYPLIFLSLPRKQKQRARSGQCRSELWR